MTERTGVEEDAATETGAASNLAGFEDRSLWILVVAILILAGLVIYNLVRIVSHNKKSRKKNTNLFKNNFLYALLISALIRLISLFLLVFAQEHHDYKFYAFCYTFPSLIWVSAYYFLGCFFVLLFYSTSEGAVRFVNPTLPKVFVGVLLCLQMYYVISDKDVKTFLANSFFINFFAYLLSACLVLVFGLLLSKIIQEEGIENSLLVQIVQKMRIISFCIGTIFFLRVLYFYFLIVQLIDFSFWGDQISIEVLFGEILPYAIVLLGKMTKSQQEQKMFVSSLELHDLSQPNPRALRNTQPLIANRIDQGTDSSKVAANYINQSAVANGGAGNKNAGAVNANAGANADSVANYNYNNGRNHANQQTTHYKYQQMSEQLHQAEHNC